ncbi:Oligopeptide transporter OPT superfamily [Penicillium occitanis (nom. inval.)]|nr:Oligopeptide transporter OPT superfamily [Penicillium occitanis (nom. inval.)]PCG96624.1 hypothetical protein PENOC_072010 [Penicillium occitanis (nom. inval.)]
MYQNGLYFWRNEESPEDRLRHKESDPNLDPHYKLTLRNGYREVPLRWWATIIVLCGGIGLGCLYVMNSTLPWRGFLLGTVFTSLFALFFGPQMGMTGFSFNMQPICQMLAGYMFPGRPLANLLPYTASHYVYAPDRGLRGCIWSGQNIQTFNSMAISWSIAPKMFSIGAHYQWVTIVFLLGFLVPLPTYIAYKITGNKNWGYNNPSIILWFMGNLYVGINSGFTSFFIVAFIFQFYVRKYHPQLFVKWNYLISAALDGGTQIIVFILTFAVAGGSGTAHPFPTWAGNPELLKHNTDHCMVNPANA